MGQLFSAKPLLFHDVHGNGIELSENKCTARCVKTANNNLLFTSHPIKANQKVLLQLQNVSNKSHDVLSIGFTSHDPSTLATNLPKNDNYELESKQGYWICTLSQYYCTENPVFYFSFNQSGNIRYGNRTKENTAIDVQIDTKNHLWAVINIWSAPTEIALLDASIPLSDNNDYTKNHHKHSTSSERLILHRDASVSTLRQTVDNSTCAICYEKSTEAALFPCGHLCMCYECAHKQWRGEGDGNCPMCRVPIQTILRIYKS